MNGLHTADGDQTVCQTVTILLGHKSYCRSSVASTRQQLSLFYFVYQLQHDGGANHTTLLTVVSAFLFPVLTLQSSQGGRKN